MQKKTEMLTGTPAEVAKKLIERLKSRGLKIPLA
jgi:hypothetical protein